MGSAPRMVTAKQDKNAKMDSAKRVAALKIAIVLVASVVSVVFAQSPSVHKTAIAQAVNVA